MDLDVKSCLLPVLGVTALSVALVITAKISSCTNTVINDGLEVTRAEVGPKALNAKYKWFKDVLAQLDNKKATISLLENKINRLRKDYNGATRQSWARTDLESLNQWETERDGVIASYNGLAAEYNSAMAKFHTAFLNAGMLPAGGVDGDLPREVRDYIR